MINGPSPAADIATTIRSLENDRYAAMVSGDIGRVVELAHPEMAYTHSNADLDTLDSYIEKLRSGFYVYHHIDHPEERLIISGDTVVVIGEMHADITAGGVRKKLANASMAVWVRNDQQWQLIGYQPTVLPQDS